MSRRAMLIFASLAAVVGAAGSVQAADVQAGQAQFRKVCGGCHDVRDWHGKSEGELTTMIKNVVSGKAKHPKKLALTDQQISDIAAWASSSG
jgi:mono/diheme cytochrome c family protein